MVFLAGILIFVVVVGLAFLFRWMGRGQPATVRDRVEHSKRDPQGRGPRATGLN